MKKIISFLSAMLLVLSLGAAPALAQESIDVTDGVTFEEMNDDSVYVKQSARGKCTLAASTMIMRRAAMLAGDEDWASITESALGSVAWRSGVGISWTFTYHGITMTHDYVSSVDEIIALLEEHPEGIVAYDSYSPHAIALLDYDAETGTFYCSDPSEYYPSGRYSVTESLIRIQDVDVVWYVTTELPELASDIQELPETLTEGPVTSIDHAEEETETDTVTETETIFSFVTETDITETEPEETEFTLIEWEETELTLTETEIMETEGVNTDVLFAVLTGEQ